MNHAPLWTAVEEQATAWAVTPIFERFAAQLPRNASQRRIGVPGLLQRMQVGSHLLQLGSTAPFMLGQLPDLQGIPGPNSADVAERLPAWLEDARRVESAHRDTIAWIRSRLPGYPSLPAPQLTPGTPLTTVEFSWRLIWTPNERTRGLQFQPAPPGVGPVLGATEGQRRRIDETARSLIAAFESTDEWTGLLAASDALNSDARAKLKNARAKLRKRLADDAVTTHEPKLAMPRDKYRQVVLTEEIETLAGAARDYADAFDAVDRLIETSCSHVFGQLAAHGNPTTFTEIKDLDSEPGIPQVVAVTLTDESWPEPGMLAWIDDPLVCDALHITSVNFHQNVATGLRQRVTGTVLEDIAAAWMRPRS